ncbi:MAG: Membrane protein insertase MisCB precursor [candidate division WS2 bacterium ADurb.Bin280]|uniref:Membrane protein insertase MisCB n=1 Tax=candidate division WS2 bacterium ADurb.Bin280 TaxID=1852829 RepID=A0A1V5SG35_9BACT|nr:MAG: Membrane protein insertase MisCB precursor [candidate division WS2 bacterium ADurb.Bin280]
MQYLTDFFYNLLVFFAYLTPGHYVWIGIVVITVLIRLAFLKPSLKLVEVQHKQKKLAPKLEELKGKHKDDKEALQRATLELYKQEGVNPLSGCLPMIVQLVVLIAFYRIFTQIGMQDIKAEYLYSFVPRPDSINHFFFGIDLSKTVAQIFQGGGVVGYLSLLFPILAGGTQLIQSLQTRALQPQVAQGDSAGFQKALNAQFTYLFPLMTAYISYTLTSALSIYWITQTLFMIVQQYYANKKFAELKEEIQMVEATAVSQGASKKVERTQKRGVVVEVREKN